MSESNRQDLRALVRGTYDLQKLRISMGNRIVASVKTSMGINIQEKEEETSDKDALAYLKEVREEYDRITDGVLTLPRNPKYDDCKLITTYTQLSLVHTYIGILRDEEAHFRRMEKILKADFPIYNAFLKGVKGCGPTIAAVILSEVDITRTPTSSALWALCGLDVAKDGQGRSRRKEHLIDRTYTTRDGKEDTKKSITFNPFLKTKLVGVLADCFIKIKGCEYRQVYDDYKHRLENDPRHAEKTPGHRHAMAKRYMIKIFLKDLYIAWRKVEGLDVTDPYHVRKLGMRDHNKGAA